MPKAMKKINTDGLPFAVYARLSRKKPTRRRGGRVVPDTETVDYQVDTLLGFAAEEGYPTADHLIFKDNHRSAWKRKGAIRPDWLRMMAAAERGEIAGILVYRLDRFARAPRDGEDLLDLAEDRGLTIVGLKSGKINLNTAAGRKQFRDMVNAAAAESDLISERTRDALGEIMRDGKPMGPARCFGFEADGTEQRPAEVAIIREMAERMLAGETLQHLADELNTRVDADGNAFTTTRGTKWGSMKLRRMLGGHRYGGFVEHHGEVVATMPGEPVLDLDTYNRVQGRITGRRRGRRPTGRFPLTGLLVCSDCKGKDGRPRTMNGAPRDKPLADGTKVREYRCPLQLGGCGRAIVAKPVEDMVDDHMLDLLSDPDHAAEVIAEDTFLSEARAGLVKERDEIDEDMANLEVKKARREISRLAYDRAMPIYVQRLAGVTAELAKLQQGKADGTYDAGADWADMTDDERRLVIERHGVVIMIGPGQRGTRKFDPTRVTIT